MKERPILFNGEMVRAILEGRKTQTRRIMKPQPAYPGIDQIVLERHPFAPSVMAGTPAEGLSLAKEEDVFVAYDWCGNPVGVAFDSCRYGQVGDRLWVRETWLQLDKDGYQDMGAPLGIPVYYNQRNGFAYKATCSMDSDQIRKDYGYKWKPSIHMPRLASRITLEITAVRAERIQHINAAEIKAEGISKTDRGVSPVAAFRELWDSINEMRGFSWDSNPWVWVIEFKLLGRDSCTSY